MSPILIVFLTLGVIMVAMFASLYVLRQKITQRTEAVRERFPTANLIISNASFYGQESKGVAQMRGNGILVLTGSELYFEMLVPQREFRIPLASIQALETPSSYLGKTNFRPLLKVVFRNESGQTDSMGWLVPDVQGLKAAIESARG